MCLVHSIVDGSKSSNLICGVSLANMTLPCLWDHFYTVYFLIPMSNATSTVLNWIQAGTVDSTANMRSRVSRRRNKYSVSLVGYAEGTRWRFWYLDTIWRNKYVGYRLSAFNSMFSVGDYSHTGNSTSNPCIAKPHHPNLWYHTNNKYVFPLMGNTLNTAPHTLHTLRHHLQLWLYLHAPHAGSISRLRVLKSGYPIGQSQIYRT